MTGYRRDQKAAEQARKARNEYAREWRARNREKVRIYNATYWQRKAAQNGKATTTEGG